MSFKSIPVFVVALAATAILMGRQSRSADEPWFVNATSCPVQLSLKELFHGVVATNKSEGVVLRYQLSCFKQSREKYTSVKRLDFVSEQLPPNHFVMLAEQRYSSAKGTCTAIGARVGIAQVTFADGAVWLAADSLQPVEPGNP